MPTEMHIFGETWLWPRNGIPTSTSELERDLDNFLQYRGAVLRQRDAHVGTRWDVDVLLYEDAEDIDGWIERLAAFLRQWGIPDQTVSVTIIREGVGTKWEHRRIDVASD